MLADDVAPTRLRARSCSSPTLLDHLKGETRRPDRLLRHRVRTAPLSADYEVLRDFLDELEPSSLPEGAPITNRLLPRRDAASVQQERVAIAISSCSATASTATRLEIAGSPRCATAASGVHRSRRRHASRRVGARRQRRPDQDEHGAAVLSTIEPATLQSSQKRPTARIAMRPRGSTSPSWSTHRRTRQRGNYGRAANVRLQDATSGSSSRRCFLPA